MNTRPFSLGIGWVIPSSQPLLCINRAEKSWSCDYSHHISSFAIPFWALTYLSGYSEKTPLPGFNSGTLQRNRLQRTSNWDLNFFSFTMEKGS